MLKTKIAQILVSVLITKVVVSAVLYVLEKSEDFSLKDDLNASLEELENYEEGKLPLQTSIVDTEKQTVTDLGLRFVDGSLPKKASIKSTKKNIANKIYPEELENLGITKTVMKKPRKTPVFKKDFITNALTLKNKIEKENLLSNEIVPKSVENLQKLQESGNSTAKKTRAKKIKPDNISV